VCDDPISSRQLIGRAMAFRCKRIIEGKTYNTETATQIASLDKDDPESGYEAGEYLYQSRFGAFFLFSFLEWHGDDDFEKIVPLTPEQAREWLENNHGHDVELIERLFGEMPEAGSGEIKFTLRLPESLRDRLAARAKANEQSLNAWIVRCLESCATEAISEARDIGRRELPPMGNMVRGNDGTWRPRGT
jgi:hypothetical protein